MTTFRSGNQVTLLQGGAEFFPALETAIEAAKTEVHVETYLYADDATATRITAALMRAAGRGVAVHVVMDGYGARDFPPTRIAEMRAAGVQVAVYRPEVARLSFRRYRLRRLHRKLTVIDGRIAFVGGINIIDDADIPGALPPPRFDFAVAVVGPVLADVCRASDRLWSLVLWSQFRQRREQRTPAVTHECGEQRAAFVVRDNLRHRRDIEQEYLRAIGLAREHILIANAYFLPGVNFRRALMDAARRGVRVTLLLQGRADHALLHYASHAMYGAFLDAGIEIFEYQKSFLHAKVAVIDGHWSTVGSSNIDPFSLLLAREANVAIEDRKFARKLATSLERAMAAGALQLQPQGWKHQPTLHRLKTWLSYALVRVMMGMAGYGPDNVRREAAGSAAAA